MRTNGEIYDLLLKIYFGILKWISRDIKRTLELNRKIRLGERIIAKKET